MCIVFCLFFVLIFVTGLFVSATVHASRWRRLFSFPSLFSSCVSPVSVFRVLSGAVYVYVCIMYVYMCLCLSKERSGGPCSSKAVTSRFERCSLGTCSRDLYRPFRLRLGASTGELRLSFCSGSLHLATCRECLIAHPRTCGPSLLVLTWGFLSLCLCLCLSLYVYVYVYVFVYVFVYVYVYVFVYVYVHVYVYVYLYVFVNVYVFVFVSICVWSVSGKMVNAPWAEPKSGGTLLEASRDTNAQIVRYTFFMGAKDKSNHLTAGSL